MHFKVVTTCLITWVTCVSIICVFVRLQLDLEEYYTAISVVECFNANFWISLSCLRAVLIVSLPLNLKLDLLSKPDTKIESSEQALDHSSENHLTKKSKTYAKDRGSKTDCSLESTERFAFIHLLILNNKTITFINYLTLKNNWMTFYYNICNISGRYVVKERKK